jgi:hypothetical protein
MSLFFGRWRFLTNGDDYLVRLALAIFGILSIALVTSGLILAGFLLRALAFVLDNYGLVVLAFIS